MRIWAEEACQQLLEPPSDVKVPLKRFRILYGQGSSMISKEFKKVLLTIVDASSSQNKPGVSIAYLSKHLDIERQPLLTIVQMLERAEYIQVQQFGRVHLLMPTLLGFEKAIVWKREVRERAWFRNIPTPVKAIVGSLIAALLGLLWWWLGLSPQTSDLQPIKAAVPIKVYQVGVQPPIEPVPGSWFDFPNAPQPGQAIYFSSVDEYGESLSELLPEYVPATFDGWVDFQFDVENIATRYQVNISSILIEVESSPVGDPEDLYFFLPQLGGGEIRKYELDLSMHSVDLVREGVQVHEANLVSGGEPVDYIFLKPGERESLEIRINLGMPGNYKLTPIINYLFRDDSSSVRTDSYYMIYPHRYRTWFWNSNPMTCSMEDCTGGDGPIMAYDVIVDTQSVSIQVPATSVHTTSSCMSFPKWIAFESSLVTCGSLNRPFLIDTNGDGLKAISAQDLHIVGRYFEWIDDNRLLMVEPILDEELRKYIPRQVRLIEPSNGRAEVVVSDTLSTPDFGEGNMWTAYYSSGREDVCLGDGKGCLVLRSLYDTDGDGYINNQDASQIFMDHNGNLTRLGFSKEDQAYLTASPDESAMAFVQGEGLDAGCNPSDVQNVYVMRIDGTELRQVATTSGWYRNPSWSPDGRYLAFESARSADNGGELTCFDSIFHIFVVDLLTGKETKLTSGNLSDYEPRWSADGQWVIAGGQRLSLSRWDGSCTQDIFIPPVGSVWNAVMQP